MQPAWVSGVISSCCDPLDFAWYEGLMAAWESGEFRDERLHWSVGIHPYCAQDFHDRQQTEPELEKRMLALAAHPRCVALGECGLDYCKAPESHEAQKLVFEQMCKLAVRLKKILVVHARDAPKDTLRILRAHVPAEWPIHLHGYTGVVADAEELMASFGNLHVGFCGALTIPDFHGSCGHCAPLWRPGCKFCGGEPEWVARDLDALIRAIPLHRVLLETDSPYLAPVQFGWVSCYPWMVAAIAEHVGTVKGLTAAQIIEASNRNAERLYGLNLRPADVDRS